MLSFMSEDIHAGPSQSHLSAHSGPAFDPLVAHPARVYNVWLGGKDHYAADRDAALRVADAGRRWWPGPGRTGSSWAGWSGIWRESRASASSSTSAPGYRPRTTPIEVAQALDPAARIVYADNDPLVLAHARALLGSTMGGACDYLDADLHDPAALLAGAARTLDLSRPAAILLLAVLHFLPDADDPAAILATLAAGLAPGSFVAISHLTSDFAPAAVASGVAAYNEAVPGGITARSHAQVSALLGGLSLVPPGVVPVSEWRPDPGLIRQPADLHAALATIRPSAYRCGSGPCHGVRSAPQTTTRGPGPAQPAITQANPDQEDPDEVMQRMLILTGLLTAAGLTAALNVTRETPDITARLPQPGDRDITIIIDDDGYIELRFWASPATTPSQITTTLTRAISAITG